MKHDVEELAALMLGLPIEAAEDVSSLEEKLLDKYEIPLEGLENIVDRLMDFTVPQVSALTGKSYLGFIEGNRFIVKKEHNAGDGK